jgi:hypothetical protein
LSPEEIITAFVAEQRRGEERREEARRAYAARTFWIKVQDPRYGPVDVETEASDRATAVSNIERRFPNAPIIEVADRAHHTDYCHDPKYAAEHASWMR